MGFALIKVIFQRPLFSIMSFVLLSSFSSCSVFTARNSSETSSENDGRIKSGTATYRYHDTSGDYQLFKEVGYLKKKNIYFVKTKILPEFGKEGDLLEKSLTISTLSKLKLGAESRTVDLLRPKTSQYTVWLDGKKYFSQLRVDLKSMGLEVLAFSPEQKMPKKSSVRLPSGNGVYCFFSQLAECIKITGFLSMARDKQSGTMSLQLIWDGYPFYHLMYENFTPEVVSTAIFEYDGVSEDGATRFELKTDREQSIYFHFDKNNELVKKVWVARGIEQERNGQSSGSRRGGSGGSGGDKVDDDRDDPSFKIEQFGPIKG
ncbi:MAG: hypothetical protein HQK53_00050 [Oligoflexia bacterium]|nr:hypothetical protein [Oligoflexia bacterium]